AGVADFRLPTLDGRTLGPADFPGQVVVLEFWATWCAPCHVQARILEEIHREYAGEGVQILGVNVGEQEEVVRAFAARNPYPYPVLLDPAEQVSRDLRVIAFPTLLVLDQQREPIWFHSGITSPQQLRELLAGVGIAAAT
ncbi:MAG TPA: TlpA disulfide reductase family protein, partial [Thermoanaerobaculia bacterium]|nr:TlpA disulfide reductase family protein [Thermoanaerobaculia bacterium]